MAGLVNGQGTPWGGTRYGTPNAPQQAKFITDPSQYASFDRSDLANKAMAGAGADTGNAINQAKARLAATGGGRSSAANTQTMNMLNAGQQKMGDIRNQAALQGWQDKMSQMASNNAFNLQQQGLNNQLYGTQAGLAENERNQRREMVSKLGPLGDFANLFNY